VAKASQVPRWRDSDVFTPPTVTDQLSARLLDRLGPAALVEAHRVHRCLNKPAELAR
jgi:hypothetical protein